jgi:ubiquitin
MLELMVAVANTCKTLEGAPERKVASNELQGVDSMLRDPGGKQLARRMDRKSPLEAEEMKRMVAAAKELAMPLLYLAARVAWATNNLINDAVSVRGQRKDLTKQVEEANRQVVKVEKKYNDYVRQAEATRKALEAELEAKGEEVEGLTTQLVDLRFQARGFEAEALRLQSIEAACLEVEVRSQQLKLEREEVQRHADDIRAQVCVYVWWVSESQGPRPRLAVCLVLWEGTLSQLLCTVCWAGGAACWRGGQVEDYSR